MKTKYTILLIGRGRLAKHLKFAWRDLNLILWDKSQSTEELHNKLKTADVVALAISDSAIESFYKDCRGFTPRDCLWVHFSGALNVDGIVDIHPLMTFGPEIYNDEVYAQIPYVSASIKSWPDRLPLNNFLYNIDPSNKAKYHALCVLGGNFSSLLWSKAITEFTKLGLPADVARTYALQSLKNTFDNPMNALTGPLVRSDLVTQEKNLKALGDDPYADIYRAFQKAYQKEKMTTGGDT